MVSPENPLEIRENIADRLRAATVAHRDAQETAARAADTWKALIVEAREVLGMPEKVVADLARVSRSRIHRVIYEHYARA